MLPYQKQGAAMNIKLTKEQVNYIYELLSHRPFREVELVMNSIKQQVEDHNKNENLTGDKDA